MTIFRRCLGGDAFRHPLLAELAVHFLEVSRPRRWGRTSVRQRRYGLHFLSSLMARAGMGCFLSAFSLEGRDRALSFRLILASLMPDLSST